MVLQRTGTGRTQSAGVQAVIAKSLCKIFFRNAINIGLLAIVCKDLPDDVQTGDTMELHMSDGTAVANGKTYTCAKLPEYMQGIHESGRLIATEQGGDNHGNDNRRKNHRSSSGVDSVKPGDIHTVQLDRLMSSRRNHTSDCRYV